MRVFKNGLASVVQSCRLAVSDTRSWLRSFYFNLLRNYGSLVARALIDSKRWPAAVASDVVLVWPWRCGYEVLDNTAVEVIEYGTPGTR